MKSTFTTPMLVSVLDDYKFRIERPFAYHVGGEFGSDERIFVPDGFITDFASIPRFLWSILPPHGKYAKAAVIHDYMYITGYNDKEYADRIFYEAMLVLRVPKWKALLMYFFVKLFGRGNYGV